MVQRYFMFLFMLESNYDQIINLSEDTNITHIKYRKDNGTVIRSITIKSLGSGKN